MFLHFNRKLSISKSRQDNQCKNTISQKLSINIYPFLSAFIMILSRKMHDLMTHAQESSAVCLLLGPEMKYFDTNTPINHTKQKIPGKDSC